MTRRVSILLIVLTVAVMGSGATSGVLLGRLTAPRAEAAARSETGLTVRFDASEPVTATVQWGAGAAVGQAVAAGTGRSGSAKLTFSTTGQITAQVQARAADGRVASSNTVAGRRLVRQVVLQVIHATLRFPARDRAGVVTSFMGASTTPIQPTTAGPVASARPYGFRPVVVTPETTSAILQLQISHLPAGGSPQTGGARLLVPLPGRGAETMSFSEDVTGVAVTLDLRVIATLR